MIFRGAWRWGFQSDGSGETSYGLGPLAQKGGDSPRRVHGRSQGDGKAAAWFRQDADVRLALESAEV